MRNKGFVSKILFSIIIPCYNQEKYIADTLKSVLAQSYPHWECILIDDGSTDDTVIIAKQWVEKDNRFKLYTKKNGGASSARNHGIEKAKGNYLLFLDSDDLIYPEYLFKVSQTLKKKKSHLVISGFETLSNDLSDVILTGQPNITGKNFFENLSAAPVAPIHSHIISKELVSEIGCFDTMLRSNEDWDFWIRAGKISKSVITLNYTGAGYRMVSSSTSRKAEAFLESSVEVARRVRSQDKRLPEIQLISTAPIEPALIKFLIMNCGTLLFSGRIEEANKMFETTVKRFNLNPAASDFEELFSYLTYTHKLTQNSKSDFWAKHIANISRFLFFCENTLGKKGLYATSIALLIASKLHPDDLSGIVPYIKTKDLIYKGTRSILQKSFNKLSFFGEMLKKIAIPMKLGIR